jgi:hypothetical protein
MVRERAKKKEIERKRQGEHGEQTARGKKERKGLALYFV